MTLYEELPVPCLCTQVAVEEAVMRVGPAFVYSLHCSAQEAPQMRRVLHSWGAQVEQHPLAPYINLIVDSMVKGSAWFLEANGKACGSKGID